MAARNEQREKRIGRRLLAIEEGREDVAVQMIDGVERPVQCEGVRFRGGDADDEAADQARTAGYGDAVEIRKRSRARTASASSTAAESNATCRRLAISGTMPPYFA